MSHKKSTREAKPTPSRKEQQTRLHIAAEAARLLAENSASDYHSAKTKAAERLGFHDNRLWPRNEEVEAALIEYQMLFRSKEHETHLARLRETALRAMALYEEFSPRVVGSVLSGTATDATDVFLHLFCDTPEQIGWTLDENKVPYEIITKRFFTARDKAEQFPAYRFVAGETSIEATVFPLKALRQPVRTSADGPSIKRATAKTLRALLEESESAHEDAYLRDASGT